MWSSSLRLALACTLALLSVNSGLSDGASDAVDGSLDVDASLLPIDLTLPTFDRALEGLPSDRWALIEFYASWCPACQNFKPHYEKLSAALRRNPLPQPEVWVARVDCATEVCLPQTREPPLARRVQTTSSLVSVTGDVEI